MLCSGYAKPVSRKKVLEALAKFQSLPPSDSACKSPTAAKADLAEMAPARNAKAHTSEFCYTLKFALKTYG